MPVDARVDSFVTANAKAILAKYPYPDDAALRVDAVVAHLVKTHAMADAEARDLVLVRLAALAANPGLDALLTVNARAILAKYPDYQAAISKGTNLVAAVASLYKQDRATATKFVTRRLRELAADPARAG